MLETLPAAADEPASTEPVETPAEVSIPDDRGIILPGEQSILIVEDDLHFAQWFLDLAHAQQFKAIVTSRGQSALTLAREFVPTAISLDISLPDMDGWKVLERLKSDLTTRHIPVFIISVAEEPQNALKYGAIDFLNKPIDQAVVENLLRRVRKMAESSAKKLLLVEDDETQRNNIRELIGNHTAHIIDVATGQEALEALTRQSFDCVVLDLMLPDISGFDLIEKIRTENKKLPIIVYTAKDLTPDEEKKLNRVAQTVIVKDVRSPERLYDQTALWLHREVARLPEEKRDYPHQAA